MRERARGFRTARTVGALVLREMESAHGRSALGHLWSVAEPVAGILLLTVVFSLAFHAPPMGNSFAFFYASGYLAFSVYLELGTRVAQSIRFSRPLLFYPGVTYLDAIAARFLLNGMTQVLVVSLVLPALILGLGVEAILDLPALALALLMAAVLALGVGVTNCFLIERFPAWERLWAVLNRPLFVVSAIFFLFESVPQPYRDWLWWNPLVHVVGQMRRGFFPTYEAAYVSAGYVFGLGGALTVLGLLLLGRHHRALAHG